MEFKPYFQPYQQPTASEQLGKVSEGIGSMADRYLQALQLKKQQGMQDMLRQLEFNKAKAEYGPDIMTGIGRSKGLMLDFGPSGGSPSTPPQNASQTPTNAPQPMFAAAGMPDYSQIGPTESEMPQTARQAPPPMLSSPPAQPDYSKWGLKQITRAKDIKSLTEPDKTKMSLLDLQGGIDPKIYQMLQRGHPDNTIDRGLGMAYLQQHSGSQKSELGLSEKNSQFNQKEWDKLIEKNNPDLASQRSSVGISARVVNNANRALDTLNDRSHPLVYQDLSNVGADLASIYQNGVPSDSSMKHNEYSTVFGNMAKIVQSLSGKPTEAVPDAIRQQLIDRFTSLKGTGYDVINRNFDSIEAAQPRVIKNFSDEWKGIRGKWSKSVPYGQGNGQPHPQDSEAVQWARQNPHDPRSPKILQLNGGQ